MTVTATDLLGGITPMLAEPGRPEQLSTFVGSWAFEEKLDGIRGLAAWGEDHQFLMRNRNGADITLRYPELERAGMSMSGPLILDGEVMAETGKFQDVAWRDKQKGRGFDEVPCIYVVFDILMHPEHGDLRSQPYTVRRRTLEELMLPARYRMVRASSDPAFFDEVRANGGEGVVAKHINGRYRPGRNAVWTKVKSLHSVTALAVGYEPGKGSREQMGAILLAVLRHSEGKWGFHPIGRAGSGFSARTAMEMKARLDAIDPANPSIPDLPVVEIECLGATRTDVLRQPIFKGLRTDLTFTAATYDQVAALPRS